MTGVTDALTEITTGHRPATGTCGQCAVGKDNIRRNLGDRDTEGPVGDLRRTALDHLDVHGVTMWIVTIPAELTTIITSGRMGTHLVVLVNLTDQAAVNRREARFIGIIGRSGVGIMTDQTSVIPAVAEGIVPLQAESVAVIDFMTSVNVMTPETWISAICVADEAGHRIVTMTVSAPLSSVDLRSDGVISKVVSIAGTTVTGGTAVGYMLVAAVTGDAGSRCRFAGRQTGPITESCIVTAATSVMRGRGTTNQRAAMTTGTAGSAGGNNTRMTRFWGMCRFPGNGMTGGTGAANGEVLADR